MSNNPTQHISYDFNKFTLRQHKQQQYTQWHATHIHLSHLSISSISAADAYDASKTDASVGSIADAIDEDEDENGLSPPVSFFYSLLLPLNGEADRHPAPVEKRKNEE